MMRWARPVKDPGNPSASSIEPRASSLEHRANDVWSRGITKEHRLVYRITGADLVILQARLHYRD